MPTQTFMLYVREEQSGRKEGRSIVKVMTAFGRLAAKNVMHCTRKRCHRLLTTVMIGWENVVRGIALYEIRVRELKNAAEVRQTHKSLRGNTSIWYILRDKF